MNQSTLVVQHADYPDIAKLEVGAEVNLEIRASVIRIETDVIDASSWDQRTYLPAGTETELIIQAIDIKP